MTVQFTIHGQNRAKKRQITEQMICTTLNKLNPKELIGYKAYIIDNSLSYILVANIFRNRIKVITIMTDKGCFNVTGKNSIVRSVN